MKSYSSIFLEGREPEGREDAEDVDQLSGETDCPGGWHGESVHAIITTIKDRCRRCYSCVRRCPTKAIRVRDGQAEVMPSRCVACGRCVRACSQGAKSVFDNLPLVRALLSQGNVVVMVAPSFPAAFPAWKAGQLIAALRRLGFSGVHEVAFGAELVAAAYAKRHRQEPERYTITTPCPAAVKYVEKYAVELIPFLAPVLSPMAALGKALKLRIRPGTRTVFLGPCTAKILEVEDPAVDPWVDSAMTFVELPKILAEYGINPSQLPEEEFDPPHAWHGGVFPIPGGLMKVAAMPSDPMATGVVELNRPEPFIEIIERLQARVSAGSLDELDTRFFDVLFCQGCVAGAAMPSEPNLLRSKERIVAYIRTRTARASREHWEETIGALADLDLSRNFVNDDQRVGMPTEAQIRHILSQTNKLSAKDELNCRACGYRSCRDKALAVYRGLAEVEMCLPYLIEQLQITVQELHKSHEEIQDKQSKLLLSERLAFMGRLAAGIAHEVNNPLGTILIFSHLLNNAVQDREELREDADLILREATRCKSIVGGLLDFARQNRVVRSMVELQTLLSESVSVVHRQLRDGRFRIQLDAEAEMPPVALDHDQMVQVVVNLLRNACDSMKDGGEVVVRAWLNKAKDEFRIQVRDSGAGIAPEHMTKLFTPFFTTKPVGSGTGLGLPICYGIVRAHQGTIVAKNNEDGPGATFEILLPRTCDERSFQAFIDDELVENQKKSEVC